MICLITSVACSPGFDEHVTLLQWREAMARSIGNKCEAYWLIRSSIDYEPYYVLGQVSFPVTIRGVICSKCGPEFTMNDKP